MAIELAGLLSDGAFHSGEELGRALGVGRAAVWKQVKALAARGVAVDAVRGKGYRLVGGLDLLDAAQISSGLNSLASASILNIDVFDCIDSTNSVAMSQLRRGRVKGYACFAEQQTSGRGRRGRPWVSPYAKNIYASLTWTFDGGPSAIQGLSIAVGCAVCEVVEALGAHDAMLKWPNDVCVGGRKLAGVLIEVVGDMGGDCAVVIGVGINVAMGRDDGSLIDQPWIDLADIGCTPRRNLVAASLLSAMVRVLVKFEREGLDAVRSSWDRLDVLRGRSIELNIGGHVVRGVALGIDSVGGLLVDTPDGRRTFSSGEVSVREWR